MKIALCMSGHARTYEQTYAGWRDNFLAHHDVDIFFHLWDTIGPREMGNVQPGQIGFAPSPIVDVGHLKSIWNPTQCVMERYGDFHHLFSMQTAKWYNTRNALGLRQIDRPTANLSMYYKWHACNELRKLHARQNNIHYDVIIRSRLDMGLYDKIPDVCFSDHSHTYITKRGSWSSIEISDYITIGTSDQLDHWCKIYELFDEKYRRALAEGDFTKALYPHNLFYYHFVDYNQPFKELDINCEIVR